MYKNIVVCIVVCLCISSVIAVVSNEEITTAIGGNDERISPESFDSIDLHTSTDRVRNTGIARWWQRNGEDFFLNSNSALLKAENSLLDHEVREPIVIHGNDDFASQAVIDGWPGDGTEVDPWIIEGYDIDATGHENAIYIGDVDAHFIIRDCILYDAMDFEAFNPPYQWPSGIQLNNTENALIYGNGVFACGAGIFVKGGSGNLVINNTVYGNGAGIMLFNNTENDVIGNTCLENFYGAIGLWSNTNSFISENDMHDNGILIFGDRSSYWNTHTIDTSNSVDGYPVYYWNGQTGGTVPADAGQVILADCTDVTVTGQEVAWAIQLGYSEGCFVENNTLFQAILDLSSSSENTIRNNEISHDYWDALILAFGSNNNTIINNSFLYSDVGIYIEFSSNGNVIANNNISSNHDEGIMLEDSMDNHIYENDILGNNWGIALGRNSFSNLVENNTVFGNHEIGIEMFGGATENVVRNNDISSGEIGIHCWQAEQNRIENNTIWDVEWTGINLGMSDHNIVMSNHISHSDGSAFHIWDSHYNHISNNHISYCNGWSALEFYDSTDNIIFGNSITDNNNGIHLGNSYHNVLEYNNISFNSDGINIWGSGENYLLNNTIRGSHAGIYVGQSDDNRIAGNTIIDNNHGLDISNSNGNLIYENILSYNMHQNINLFQSELNTIYNNTISGSDIGVFLDDSFDNLIRSNLIVDNIGGIDISNSMHNQIEGNEIAGNDMAGIDLRSSHDNGVYENNIHDNWVGIALDHSNGNFMIYNHIWNHELNGVQSFSSFDNEFYHNIFENNQNHAYDEGNNLWDNGYPSGGNYWDTHTSPDNNFGPMQDQLGPDGIVDDPYYIPGGENTDGYPLATEPLRRIYDLELFATPESDGWQFVSLQMIPDDPSMILESIYGSFERVMYYDASSDRWESYMPDRAEHYNNLYSWDYRMGLWIRMIEDDQISIPVREPTVSSVTLYPGWNMIGLPSESAGNHGLPAEVTRIGYFDAMEEYNVAYSYDPASFEFEPGKGYWVYNGDDEVVVWTVDY